MGQTYYPTSGNLALKPRSVQTSKASKNAPKIIALQKRKTGLGKVFGLGIAIIMIFAILSLFIHTYNAQMAYETQVYKTQTQQLKNEVDNMEQQIVDKDKAIIEIAKKMGMKPGTSSKTIDLKNYPNLVKK